MFFEDDFIDDNGISAAQHTYHDATSFEDLRVDEFARDIESWKLQTTGFTCAVVSQQMILEQFGIEASETQLVYEATSGGFLTSAGSSTEDIGRLLESHGVSTHQSFGVEGMLSDLAQGHKVIVAVDSGELWGNDWTLEDRFSGEAADHALVVNGLDLSDPDNPLAVLNDPGHPNGAGVRVPLGEFLDAWNDSGQFYVATDDAPPSLASDPVLGTSYQAETGMYMTPTYWESFAHSRGIVVENLLQNVDAVSERLMADGSIGEAYAGSIMKTVTQSFRDLTDDQRNELLREI